MITQEKMNLKLMIPDVTDKFTQSRKERRDDWQDRRKRMAIRQIQLAFRLGYDF